MAMTKKEMFAFIATVNADKPEIVEFCNHQIEMLENRKTNKSDKPSKAQRENAELAERVIAVMGVEPMSATEIMEAVNHEKIRSTQKARALVGILMDEGRVESVKEGKKVLFRLALDVDEGEGEGEE